MATVMPNLFSIPLEPPWRLAINLKCETAVRRSKGGSSAYYCVPLSGQNAGNAMGFMVEEALKSGERFWRGCDHKQHQWERHMSRVAQVAPSPFSENF
jgi:hypothetical protein